MTEINVQKVPFLGIATAKAISGNQTTFQFEDSNH